MYSVALLPFGGGSALRWPLRDGDDILCHARMLGTPLYERRLVSTGSALQGASSLWSK
jgi:hypothetical protein